MISRRNFLAASAVFPTLSYLSWTSAFAATPKNVLVVAMQLDNMTSLDPHEGFESVGAEICGNMYHKLVAPNLEDPDKVDPQIAESWTASEDGKTFTFKIRKGLKFSSGAPVTAEDCAFSLQRAVKLNKSPAFIITQFGFNADNAETAITAPDADTVVLKTENPTALGLLLYCLSANVGAIIEKKAALDHAEGDDLGNAWLRQNSAGSGEFMLKIWRASDSVVLLKNPNGDYKGNIERIIMRHIVDPSSQLLMLKQGDVDIARNLLTEQLKGLEGDDSIKLMQKSTASIMLMSLNQAVEKLQNPKVWEAFKWAVGYHAMQKNIVPMTYVVHQAIVPEGLPGAYNENPFEQDLEKAKALLAEAGYPDGFEIEIDHYSAPPYPDIAQAIQADLGKIGIKVTLLAAENRQVLTKMRARKHQVALSSWGTDYFDPNSNVDVFCINHDNSDDATTRPFCWRSHFQDDKIAKMAEDARDEPDPETRIKKYVELQKYYMNNSPFVVMMQSSVVAAMRPNVEGVRLGTLPDSHSYAGTSKA
ncbi:ABC transporter substrate-binding protein [Breoghania sp. JC706]|uniref:ABC transporter substrate-binding protein n=1 Tax=Breoghania sp. JC706 TaxID=3117732 RepID=UPI00300931A1